MSVLVYMYPVVGLEPTETAKSCMATETVENWILPYVASTDGTLVKKVTKWCFHTCMAKIGNN